MSEDDVERSLFFKDCGGKDSEKEVVKTTLKEVAKTTLPSKQALVYPLHSWTCTCPITRLSTLYSPCTHSALILHPLHSSCILLT